MSRGPGSTQRAVMAALLETPIEWHAVLTLAAGITGLSDPPRAVTESVRRAVRRLAEDGRVELDYLDEAGRTWSALGEGRNAYEPGHRPVHPVWKLAARVGA